jgi:hypothetical protein
MLVASFGSMSVHLRVGWSVMCFSFGWVGVSRACRP